MQHLEQNAVKQYPSTFVGSNIVTLVFQRSQDRGCIYIVTGVKNLHSCRFSANPIEQLSMSTFKIIKTSCRRRHPFLWATERAQKV